MKDFLQFLISKIVEKPEELEIAEATNEYGEIMLDIKAPSEQIGMIIGKRGKIIQAIRALVKILAVKENARVRVNVLEKTA